MITIGDIFNRIGAFWEWIRTGFIMIRTGLSKVHAWAYATFIASFVAMKEGYKVIMDLITDKFTQMQTMGTAIAGNVQSSSGEFTGMEFIQNANAIFPIEETLAAIVLLFEFWVFCIVFKMALKLKNLIWFKVVTR